MGLNDTITKLISVADKATKTLQVDVTHKPWLADDVRGKPQYGSATTLKGIVERDRRTVRSRNTSGDDVELITVAKVTFLSNVTLKHKDLLTLVDGTSGPIVSIKSVDNPAGGGYAMEVRIGEDAGV